MPHSYSGQTHHAHHHQHGASSLAPAPAPHRLTEAHPRTHGGTWQRHSQCRGRTEVHGRSCCKFQVQKEQARVQRTQNMIKQSAAQPILNLLWAGARRTFLACAASAAGIKICPSLCTRVAVFCVAGQPPKRYYFWASWPKPPTSVQTFSHPLILHDHYAYAILS